MNLNNSQYIMHTGFHCDELTVQNLSASPRDTGYNVNISSFSGSIALQAGASKKPCLIELKLSTVNCGDSSIHKE